MSQAYMSHTHDTKITTPFYADPDDGCMIHRYLDDQFIDRFKRESVSGKLTGIRSQQWRIDDRFGKDRVTLRLPIHRTFYIVSCEISCDRIGNPAFDPAKIVSAGLVVRKGSPDNYRCWQIRDGVSIGWRAGKAIDVGQEPDHYRRLVNRDLIKARKSIPPYSGEQTHPLHPEVVRVADGNGNERNHTLLYGYLPLSGSVEANLASDVDNESTSAGGNQVSAMGQLAEHEWPFGSWDGVSTEPVCTCSGNLTQVATDVCGHFTWYQTTGLQINNGVPTRAFAGFLATLMHRYHIFDLSNPDNESLRTILSAIHFYASVIPLPGQGGNASLVGLQPTGNLLNYLVTNRDALLEWLSGVDRADTERLKQNLAPLANLPLLPATTNDLYIQQHQAATLREQLILRAEQAEQLVEKSLPLPRYTQGKDDTFFVVPFVRYLDECGKENIIWGPASHSFRVASPLDAEASRPTVIQLPEFNDIKKGFARGVTFLTPKSMADAIEGIVPDMDIKKQNKKNRLDACLGFSISFSIPVITICAMILLMIILSLLNIIFFWLPWVFLKLPRFCAPKLGGG